MSDSQVLEYVKDGIRQGKEQKQLASELARRGVTKEQATRVKYNRQIKKFPTEKQNVSLKHILT